MRSIRKFLPIGSGASDHGAAARCTRGGLSQGWWAIACMVLVGLSGCQDGGSTSAVAAQGPADAKPAADDAAEDAAAEATANSDTKADKAAQAPAEGSGRTNPRAARQPEANMADPFANAITAPALQGGVEWLNTAGPIDLKDLKGKFVLLDFWTYCCINCMHILPELKKLERAYPNELVVIGVHSAKFDTERDSENIREAIQRYEIEHPVVNDANHMIWNRYAVRSWPSIRIIDPEGRLIAGDSGEIPFEAFDAFFKKVIPYYERKGVLDRTPLKFALELEKLKPTPLRFPGKVLADPNNDRLFITDSNYNRIVITRRDGQLLDIIGSGEIGERNGNYAEASFNHPQGLALHGDTLYVADTENHLIRKVDLNRKLVGTIAGTGAQARGLWPGIKRDANGAFHVPKRFVGKPRLTPIASPWALWVHGEDLFIAMAGPHQIWRMPLDLSEIGPYAGNGREDIVDGLLLPAQPYEQQGQAGGELVSYSSFAQPSGLGSDGKMLYVADSEGSSIRAVPLDGKGRVETVVGTSHLPEARLFTFGDVDGSARDARLQHCLGVAYHDGKLYVADTYNNKIKEIDLQSRQVSTFVGTGERGLSDDPPRFDEPAGVSIADGKLYVADTNNHAIRVVDLKTKKVSTLTISGLNPPEPPKADSRPSFPNATLRTLPVAKLAPTDGKVQLQVQLKLPAGWKLNADAPMSYYVEGRADSGVINPQALNKSTRLAQPATDFEVELPVTGNGKETLKIGVTYYYCQEGLEALCKVGSIVWTVPVEVAADGQKQASLEFAIEK